MKFLLAQKIGMSQVFDEAGKMIPVTILQANENCIIGTRDVKKDGYSAYIVGVNLKKGKDGKKRSDFKKIVEFRMKEDKSADEFNKDQKFNVEVFNESKEMKISGLSKGKGFQGVVKRYGFKGGPATHGHKHNLRQPGSIGSVFPMRVLKGKRMAGRMGYDQITLRGIKVVNVIPENNTIVLKGAVPGRKGTWIKLMSYED